MCTVCLSIHFILHTLLTIDVIVKICIKTSIAPHIFTVQFQIFSEKFLLTSTLNKMKIVIFFFAALLLNNVQGQTPSLATQVASYIFSHTTIVKTGTTFSLSASFTPTAAQLTCFQSQGVNDTLILNAINVFGPALKAESFNVCQNVIKATGCASIGLTYGKTGSTYAIQLTNVPAQVQSGFTVAGITAAIAKSPFIAGLVQIYGVNAIIGGLKCFV